MKKLIISLLTATLMLSIMAVPAVATSTDYVQELADAAIEIGKQQGLSGDELQTFIQNYIKDNMPQEILEQEHNQNNSVSYEDRLKLYNEMKERITIIYRDSILGFKYGSISYHADAEEWLKQLSELAALGVSANDLEEPKTHFTFQWVTDCTLDGYVLAKDFNGQCGVFSLDKKDFVIKFDEKYDLSCGEEYSPFTPNYDGAKYLLSFHIKTTYDLSDKETLRIMEEFPYLLAKDNTTGKYGYLNWHTGEVAIPFIYDAATPFGDGLAAVKKGEYWGYIDADNNVKIDFKYAYAYPFNHGIAQAEGKLIDKNGNILVSSSYTEPCALYACGTNYYLSKIQMINITTGIIEGVYTVYNHNGEKISEKTFIGNTQNDGVTELTYTNEGIISGKFNGEYFKLETVASGKSKETTANLSSFSDVPSTHWAYKNIMAMTSKGLFSGTTTPVNGVGTFAPDKTMTRAEFVTVVIRAMYADELNAMPKVDAGEAWYLNSYELALDKGILKEKELDNGDLSKGMSRQEMALVLVRAAEKLGETPSQLVSTSKIADYSTIGTYYRDYVVKAYSMGMLAGTDSQGTYAPKATMNRAQGATVLNRLTDSSSRSSVDFSVPAPVSGAITIYEGQSRSNRPAQAGDTFVKADGTKVVLQKDQYGIIGGNQGVAPDIGLYYNGEVCEDQGVFTYDNRAVSFTDSLGNDLSNRTYMVNRTTGTGHWDAEWQYLESKIARPSSPGKDGDVSQDAYHLYRWSSVANFWVSNTR